MRNVVEHRGAVLVDRRSPVPIYHQIAEILRDELRASARPRARALTEEGLTRRFQVSRAPVRQALRQLTDEGYVYRERSKGTFAYPGPIRAPLRMGHLMRHLREQGLHPTSKVFGIRRVRPPELVRSLLQLGDDQDVFTMNRLIDVDGQPVVWVRTWLNVPSDFATTADELERDETLLGVLERRGIRIDRGEVQIWASAASAEQARMLRIRRGSPVLVTNTSAFGRDGMVRAWIQTTHRADRYKYVFGVTR